MEVINFKIKKMQYYKTNKRNYIKIQKFVIFLKTNLKIKMLKTKNIIN